MINWMSFLGAPPTEREAVDGPPAPCLPAGRESADQRAGAPEGGGADVLRGPDAGWRRVRRESGPTLEGGLGQNASANPDQAHVSERGQGQTTRSGSCGSQYIVMWDSFLGHVWVSTGSCGIKVRVMCESIHYHVRFRLGSSVSLYRVMWHTVQGLVPFRDSVLELIIYSDYKKK